MLSGRVQQGGGDVVTDLQPAARTSRDLSSETWINHTLPTSSLSKPSQSVLSLAGWAPCSRSRFSASCCLWDSFQHPQWCDCSPGGRRSQLGFCGTRHNPRSSPALHRRRLSWETTPGCLMSLHTSRDGSLVPVFSARSHRHVPADDDRTVVLRASTTVGLTIWTSPGITPNQVPNQGS